MTKLRIFLDGQEADLRAKLGPLSKKCGELRASLTQAERALKILREELAEVERARNAIDAAELQGSDPQANPAMTIKEAVMNVLFDHPTGLSAREILQECNSRYYEGRLKRESLSPQLSRLRNDDKKIALKGSRWVPKNEAEQQSQDAMSG